RRQERLQGQGQLRVGSGQARLQGQERVQGLGRLQDRRGWARQELLQGQGWLQGAGRARCGGGQARKELLQGQGRLQRTVTSSLNLGGASGAPPGPPARVVRVGEVNSPPLIGRVRFAAPGGVNPAPLRCGYGLIACAGGHVL